MNRWDWMSFIIHYATLHYLNQVSHWVKWPFWHKTITFLIEKDLFVYLFIYFSHEIIQCFKWWVIDQALLNINTHIYMNHCCCTEATLNTMFMFSSLCYCLLFCLMNNDSKPSALEFIECLLLYSTPERLHLANVHMQIFRFMKCDIYYSILSAMYTH